MTTPRRRLWGALALVLGLGLLLGGAAVWYLSPPWYEAFALVKVSARPPAVLDGRPLDREEFEVFKRTQVQLLRSNMVLNSTLRQQSISKLPIVEQHKLDPVAWLKEQLVVEYPDDAEVMLISLRSDVKDDLVPLVNALAATYLKEVVQHDKQLRLQSETKLQTAYEKQQAEYQKQLDALKALESIHKAKGSEEAKLKKELAREELSTWTDRRRELLDQLNDANLELALLGNSGEPQEKETGEGEQPAETEPASANVEPPKPPGPGLAKELLERKRVFLEQQLSDVTTTIANKTNELLAMESFSSQVTAKQEELEALRNINNQLRAELDRIAIERLAPDRVTLVEEASLAEDQAPVRWLAAAGSLAAVGLLLVASGGVSLARRR